MRHGVPAALLTLAARFVLVCISLPDYVVSYLMLSNQFLSNTYPKKSCIGFCLHQFGLCPPCGRVKACEIIDEITVQGVLHRNTAAKRKDNTNDGSPSNHSSRRQTKVATGSVMFRWLIFLTPSGDTCNVSYFFSSS